MTIGRIGNYVCHVFDNRHSDPNVTPRLHENPHHEVSRKLSQLIVGSTVFPPVPLACASFGPQKLTHPEL